MTFRSEHHRERVAAAATLLHELWGDGLPPGRAPWQRVVADVLAVDEAFGQQSGLAVQGDDLALAVLAEALSYVPAGASLHAALPESLVVRMRNAAAVGDPDERSLTARSRLLSAAVRSGGARWAAVYRHEDAYADLDVSLGMTPWERDAYEHVYLPGDGVLCAALQEGRCRRGPVPVPVTGGGWGGEPELVDAPCVAVPFPSTGPDAPATGALLLVWPADADPDPAVVQQLITPLAAEAEHLVVSRER